MITPTINVMFEGLRAFILSLIPDTEVIQGLGNGVPMPANQCIYLTWGPQLRTRTNENEYDRVAGTRIVTQGTEVSLQVDCYGPIADVHAATLSTMMLDPYACDMMRPYGFQPLYASDPQASALITGEENYELRYMLTAVLQFNPVVTVPQQFAEELEVTLVNAYTTYPIN